MRKIGLITLCLALATACEKHDPILPGVRTAIFNNDAPNVLNTNVPDLPANIADVPATDCPYTQDTSNVVWDGSRKIFSGFPTSNSVKSTQRPVCDGKYVYAGLTTGELVKINPTARQVIWIADIYRPSNMTGGASVVDIVAPIVVQNDYVYVGGMGDAFCKINARSGTKTWCIEISVSQPFIVTDVASFVVGTDNQMYAVRNSDGAIYWQTAIKHMDTPKYADKVITIGRQKIDAETGAVIK